MQKNYDVLAAQIIEQVGGEENIIKCYHCMTRLRFDLKNTDNVKLSDIKKLDVSGAQFIGSQLQIIIGTDVKEVYEKVCEKAKIQNEASEEKNNAQKQNPIKRVLNATLGTMSSVIAPLIPAFIACGLIKSLTAILESAGVLITESTTYSILSLVGDAGFYFMPVFVGFSSAKKFGMNQYMGALLGAMLIHPDFLSLVEAGTGITLFSLPVYAGTYTSTVFSSILCIWVASYVEKFFNKRLPAIIRSAVTPFLTLLIMVPLAFCILAPSGQFVGDYLATGISFLYTKLGFFAVAIYAFINPLIVAFGMSYCIGPVMFNNLATLGYDSLVSVGAGLNNMSQLAACFAVALKAKNPKIKSDAWAAVASNALGGVSEPCLFGITIPLKRPLFAAMIGSFVGGCVSGILSVKVYVLASQSIYVYWTAFTGAATSNIIFGILGWGVAMVVTFILTWIFGFNEEVK